MFKTECKRGEGLDAIFVNGFKGRKIVGKDATTLGNPLNEYRKKVLTRKRDAISICGLTPIHSSSVGRASGC